MKKSILLISLLSIVFLEKETQAQTREEFYALQDKVDVFLMEKDYAQAFKYAKPLLKLSEKPYTVNVRGKDTLVFRSPYTALLSHSMYYASIADYDSMYYYFDIAVEKRNMDSHVFLDNLDVFYPIYHDKRTLDIKKRMLKNQLNFYGKSVKNKELFLKVHDMFEKDQYQRNNYEYCKDVLKFTPQKLDSLKQIWIEVDNTNQSEMVKLLDEYGYIGKSLVGEANQNNAFFIIQHFPSLELQKKYLPMLIEAGEKGELSEDLLMLLKDRINVREGKEQIYGTQHKVEGTEGVIISE